MMFSPIFSPSNNFVGPERHPYPSKYLLEHVFLVAHSQNGGVVLISPLGTTQW